MRKIILTLLCLFFCGVVSAQQTLSRGKEYYGWRDYQRALPYLQSAAKEGYGEACYLLGEMYYMGYGVEQNYPIAMRMYMRGLEYGYDKGEAELGRMYENGSGCAKDPVKAFEFYRKSSARGDLFGTYLLARCYLFELGTAADNEKAFGMLRDLYQNKDFQRNYKWAYEWSCMYLGHCYQYGWGTPVDLKEAVTYYYRSEKAGSLYEAALLVEEHKLSIYPSGGYSSSFRLSKEFLLGRALERGLDDAEARYKYVIWGEGGFDCLYRSAESGYGPAQKLLGDWYKQGKETPVNLLKAREWYAKAKANGEEVPE